MVGILVHRLPFLTALLVRLGRGFFLVLILVLFLLFLFLVLLFLLFVGLCSLLRRRFQLELLVQDGVGQAPGGRVPDVA